MNPAFEIPLWPAAAPGSAALTFDELIEERSPDTSAFFDRAITRISRPRLAVFRPERPNGAAILLVPGGGYQRVVWDKEGVDVARWLTGLGVTVCVLVYRLPAEGHEEGRNVPLQDAQRAMRLVRQHTAEWDVDVARVGAMGFSAGGHVVSSLATGFDRAVYAPVDAADGLSARPDFVVLGYPVISMDAVIAHAGSRQNLLGAEPDAALLKAHSSDECVDAATPETFILLPDDDAAVPPENSIRYYLALRKAGVKAELHVFRDGGHGFGIRLATGPVSAWTRLCENWLRQNRWLP
ncbi:alpha/beta hydrolase [Uliginosibacterium sp. H3]|uniref:Alpha/beta hydrolase n=1 Tax=Uliginosibacterium silvisoli TaxID=3114758 RepID=A0ABU6KAJ5_9RHOO|nr:alpha/beta hydrolase [Uliginosibacterium sp. H3]